MSYNFQGAVILKMKIPRAVREGVVMKQTVYTASPESQQIHVWS
ncbi:6-phosphogluconolactonase, partial [Klebsiella variicola]